MCVPSTHRYQKTVSYPLALELQIVRANIQILETEPRSSERVASTLII